MKSVTFERGLVRTHAGYIHYRSAGSGPAIVLNHINQQSSALYLELMQVLAPKLRAIAIDYPSHGSSDPIDWQPSIHTYARCVVEVLDALGIERACALGEAVGAAVTTELACDFPNRIERAVLVNCPFYPDRGAADRSHAPIKSGLRPADASGFPLTRTVEFLLENDPAHAPMRPTQSWMDRINTAQIEAGRNRWQALDALHEYALNANLGRIRQPTLLLIGEHFHYARFRDEFAQTIERVELHVIPGARFCMGWERAEDIGRRTLGFLG
jgi:pimeloyl-ACP methyl ester carboxylesterase